MTFCVLLLMVHFSRSAGFVLYLIYLIDRKKNGEKVDTLNIVQYKQLFGKLYEMVYGYNGETVFTDMVKNYNAEGEMRQKGLYTVLKSIREDVGNTCERMQEPAEPFLLQDTTAHLAVLPEHIILPDEINHETNIAEQSFRISFGNDKAFLSFFVA